MELKHFLLIILTIHIYLIARFCVGNIVSYNEESQMSKFK